MLNTKVLQHIHSQDGILQATSNPLEQPIAISHGEAPLTKHLVRLETIFNPELKTSAPPSHNKKSTANSWIKCHQMQLSMQCTRISLNLTRMSNQARRLVERMFSNSKYASSIHIDKRELPKLRHLLFIIFHSWASHQRQSRGRRTLRCLPVEHGPISDACLPHALDFCHVSLFKCDPLIFNSHRKLNGRMKHMSNASNAPSQTEHYSVRFKNLRTSTRRVQY